MTPFAFIGILLLLTLSSIAMAFVQPLPIKSKSSLCLLSVGSLTRQSHTVVSSSRVLLRMSLSNDEKESEGKSTSSSGVVELGDDDDEDEDDRPVAAPAQSHSPTEPPRQVAPFLSQGEIDPNTAKVDFSDPQQTRVIVYMILSLLPVLFLIPFMLSREFIPAEYLPPVDL